jgi:hypothetical protein
MTAEDILVKYANSVVDLGLSARNYILNRFPGITEQPDQSANVIGYGFGPGYKDMICTIIPSKKGIKIGLNKGASLPDPGKLLAGTGKVHKYVELKSAGDLENPAFSALLDEVLRRYHEAKK